MFQRFPLLFLRVVGVALFLSCLIGYSGILHAEKESPQPASAAKNTGTSLLLLLRPVEGDLDFVKKTEITKLFEDLLFLYPELSVFTAKEFQNQIGWERQEKNITCQFPEDCEAELFKKLGLRHTMKLNVLSRNDGQFNVRMSLLEKGEKVREAVETIPEMSFLPTVMKSMIEGLVNSSPFLHSDQGVIHASSFPLRAKLSRDGIEICETPCSLIARESETLTLSATRPGHPTFTEKIKIQKGEVVRWNADLVTRQGDALIDSQPAGATIYIDDKEAGVTPEVVRGILQGPHKVVLRLPPYPDGTHNVTIDPENLTRIQHSFLPEHASIDVTCLNRALEHVVEIYLNGAKVAENLYKADLPPGHYTITVVQEGFENYEESLNLEAGQSKSVTVTMKPGLALRPGQIMEHKPDYRPGGFTLAAGALLTAFGAFLEIEAQSHYKNGDRLEAKNDTKNAKDERKTAKDCRIGGGVMMGVGSAAIVAGTFLLIFPPDMPVAVLPSVEPTNKSASLNLALSF